MLDLLTETTTVSASFTILEMVAYTLVSLVLGLCVAGIYMFRNTYTKSFVITLALMPAIVQMVIMMVNGNLGTGVAVMGAFSLVRFRSAPGGAKEICAIFLAMALGLATGMGYVLYAVIFLLIIGAAMMILSAISFGSDKTAERMLRITIPEDMDYDGAFDDLFAQYTRSAKLERVRTTNMGSLYELEYLIVLQSSETPKAFIDAIRCRNGNLNIVCSHVPQFKDAL